MSEQCARTPARLTPTCLYIRLSARVENAGPSITTTVFFSCSLMLPSGWALKTSLTLMTKPGKPQYRCKRLRSTYFGSQEIRQRVVESISKHCMGDDSDLLEIRRRSNTLGPVNNSFGAYRQISSSASMPKDSKLTRRESQSHQARSPLAMNPQRRRLR